MRGLSLSLLCCLLVLSCSKESPSPTAPPANASAEEAGPWQTVEINGALYRRVAAKPTETSQADLLITIPIRITTSDDGSFRFADTVVIAGRTYTADCGTGGDQPVGGDDVGNDRSSATSLPVPDPYGDDTFYESPTYELTAGDRDYFRLVLERHQDLSIASFGTTDTYGQLLDEAGNVLDEDDNGFTVNENPQNFFLYGYRLTPGIYYLVVRGAQGATGFYTVGLLSSEPSAAKITVAAAAQKMSEQRKKIRR